MRGAPQPGYEWQLDLQVTYALDDAGLTVTFQAVNTDSEPAPFGVGFHPYLTLGHGLDRRAAADCAGHRLPRLEQAGRPADDGAGRGDAAWTSSATQDRIDSSWTPLRRPGSRRVTGEPSPDWTIRTTGGQSSCGSTTAYRYLMVYTADQVGRPERRRTAVAIEPMTCPPDAFRSGTDLIELEPGESWRGIWGLGAESVSVS